MEESKGSRKLKSQKMCIVASLTVILPYMGIMAYLKQPPEMMVIGLGLIAVGGDAVAMKLANALGDHGALKK